MKRMLIASAFALVSAGCNDDGKSSSAAADSVADLLAPAVTAVVEAPPTAGGALPAALLPPAG
jgi:hypothetical protein